MKLDIQIFGGRGQNSYGKRSKTSREQDIKTFYNLTKQITIAKRNLTRKENAYKLASGTERMAERENMTDSEYKAIREKRNDAYFLMNEAKEKLNQLEEERNKLNKKFQSKKKGNVPF